MIRRAPLILALMVPGLVGLAHAASFSITQDVAGQYVFCELCPPPTRKILDIPETAPKPVQAAEVLAEASTPQPVAAVPKKKALDFQVLFQLNSSSITPKAAAVLGEVAKAATGGASITIVGHTDKLGKASHNKWLAQERAKSVKRYLVKRGVDAANISLDSSCCIEHPPLRNPAARRVEIKVM